MRQLAAIMFADMAGYAARNKRIPRGDETFRKKHFSLQM